MTDQTAEQRMAEVLGKHRIRYESDGDYGERQWIECNCDADAMLDYWTGQTEADHEAHVAAALVAAGFGDVRQAGAEALREAAKDLPGFDGIRTHGDAADWLRKRADRIGGAR